MYRTGMPQLDIRKIADSGQIFRFNKTSAGEYELIAGDRFLRIYEAGEVNEGGISFLNYDFDCSEKEFKSFWFDYFDLATDYESFGKNIPKEDDFLNRARAYSRGIRILNQDKWEMLISFIISQRKSIPAIKTSIEKLAEKFGTEIAGGRYAFPTPKQLAAAELYELEACSLGYRAPYIYRTARMVASGEYDLESLNTLDDEELLKALMELRGVGIKVANCVALFGYHRIGAFPIDVWISKMIDRHYEGRFPLELYEGYAGVIQQYIFFYGREAEKIKEVKEEI